MQNTFMNEREQSILAALYTGGQLSVSDLAKATLINRTTLYPQLQKLLEKGLVTSVQTEGRVFYEAIPVSELESWAERKQQEAEQAATRLTQWARQMKGRAHTSLVTDIKYFDGLEGVMNLYNDTWRENKEKTIYAITDYEKAYSVVGDAFLRDNYFEKRIAHEVQVKSLLPDSRMGRADVKNAKELLRDMRFINLFEDLGIEINIYDDKIALFSFDEKKPSGVLIKNATIAGAFKHIFEYLWKSSKKPPV